MSADVIIVGAGIQGCSMALAAVARGLRPVVVERDRPGAGASGNSFGIVHGGLRYLQTLDLARWRRSRLAQSWYQQHYPDHVRPLRCVMPLYAGKLRSPALFAAARGMEASLGAVLNLPEAPGRGGAMSVAELRALLPLPEAGLVGGAYWHDLELIDAPALIAAMLADACDGGATVLRNHEAEKLAWSEGSGSVIVRDRSSGRRRSLSADTVIDCSGRSVGGWSEAMRRAVRPPSCATLAYNLILDMPPPPPGTAIAVSRVPGAGRSLFLRNQGGRTLAGTFYAAAPKLRAPHVPAAEIAHALAELRACLPAIDLDVRSVRGVTAGLLPDTDGSGRTVSGRDRCLAPLGRGFYMLISSKLTTAPLLSERLAARLWPAGVARLSQQPALQHA